MWNWLVLSSADPEKTALTVKGFLALCVTYLTVLLGWAHLGVSGDMLSTLVDPVVNFVQNILLVVSSFVTVYGAARKLYKTVAGTNAVLN